MSTQEGPGPERYAYRHVVEAQSIDMLGHVSNIEFVRWIQDAALLHAQHVGYGWEQFRALGAAFVIRRHEIDYHRAASLGDELEVATWLASYTRISAVRVTEIRGANGALLVGARTQWVWVALDTMRPQRIPDAVRVIFGGAPHGRG